MSGILCGRCRSLPIWCRCDWHRCGECRGTYARTARNGTGFCSWECFDAQERPGAPEALLAFMPEGVTMKRVEGP